MRANKDPRRVAEVGFSLGSFAHCQQISDYLARLSSSESFDIERQTTLLSMHINELLEFIYVVGAGESTLHVEIQDKEARFAATLPATEDVFIRYKEALAPLLEGDPKALFEAQALSLLRAPAPSTGLLELVAVFGDKLSLERLGDSSLRLTLTTIHEQA